MTAESGTALRAPEVRLEEITKRFGSTVANDRASVRFAPGSIHALVGENGAGKSTLMRVLYGLLRPDAGRIWIDGAPRTIASPAQALECGIGMIHQHFMLVPPMRVLENIALGCEGLRGLHALPRARLAAELRRLFTSYGFEIDPEAPVAAMGVGARQRVEIARLLYRGARVLICDEPTAVLAPPEVASFFENLRRLRSEGRTVVLITHKLSEVLAIADRVTVLRKGRVVGEMERDQIRRDALVQMIMGPARAQVDERGDQPTVRATPIAAAPSLQRARAASRGAGPALQLRQITLRGSGGRSLLERIDLEVAPGEILGIAGVAGNGQSELAEVASGRRVFDEGVLRVGGCFYEPGKLPAARERPSLIPEDRNQEGLIGAFRLWENLLLGRTEEAPFVRRGLYAHGPARRWARRQLERFAVAPPDEMLAAHALSGGNQQKLLCARELTRGGSVLVAAQPTRGVDIASIAFIHSTLREFRAAGGGVLLISADLDEILALSDRVAVLYRGRLGRAEARADVDMEGIGRAMVGLDGSRPAV